LSEAPDGEEALTPILAYLNRLSDYLFVLARFCNHTMGTAESCWDA
jgi:cob(I)alamin adenosyltransferase